jgi:hypothetical protein
MKFRKLFRFSSEKREGKGIDKNVVSVEVLCVNRFMS